MAFELPLSETRDVATKVPTELGQLLAETATQRAEICAGVYVFETQKGWRDMHRLRGLLASMSKPFLELPFEEALAGFFPLSVCDRLREIGKSSGAQISLLNLYP